MTVEVLVPNLPESVADAILVAWHKQPGDSVQKDDNLVDLETDKIVLEVPAPENGILKSIDQPNGATVSSGQLLAVIDANGSAAATPTTNKLPNGDEQAAHTLSPSVRRLIKENNLDPSLIVGTGKDGRLAKVDVLNFLEKQSNNQKEIQFKPVESVRTVENKTSFPAEPGENRPEQRVPMTRLRARVALRLLQAQQNAAMLTTFNEVNLKNVIALRNQYKAHFEKQHAIKLGFMSFFVKASVEALKRFSIVNASVDEQDIIYHGYYDVGIALATERGLLVPILRDADQLDFANIEKAIVGFGKKVQDGSLSVDDLTGGTFTITNGGTFGSMMSTPILNPPQSAILGMHAIKDRPIVENGEIVIRPMMYLALSYDHRTIDGREAVQFLSTIKKYLEDPARLLLNV